MLHYIFNIYFRPKKLLKHGTGGNLVLIGSENQGNNTNITNGDTSTILERHPKPIAVSKDYI